MFHHRLILLQNTTFLLLHLDTVAFYETGELGEMVGLFFLGSKGGGIYFYKVIKESPRCLMHNRNSGKNKCVLPLSEKEDDVTAHQHPFWKEEEIRATRYAANTT